MSNLWPQKMLLASDPYLSCDECFARVDVEIEKLLQSGTPLSDSLQTHLDCCPACFEEAQSLLTLLEK